MNNRPVGPVPTLLALLRANRPYVVLAVFLAVGPYLGDGLHADIAQDIAFWITPPAWPRPADPPRGRAEPE